MAVKFIPMSSSSKWLHLACCVTAALWGALLAITFSDNTPLIAAATGVWLLWASITLLFAVFLARRPHENRARRNWGLVAIPLGWTVATLFVCNAVLANWLEQQRLWSGFVFNARFGWYPEPHLVKRKLSTPHGSYLASTDDMGHRNLLPYPADNHLPIVIQGDSNTFGFGLNDDETLAALLNARLKTPQVYNFGVPGFDLNHYYYQYDMLRGLYRMQTRIIHWNIGNDFTLSALETPNYFRRPYLYVTDGKVHEAADFQAPIPVQGYGQSFIPPYQKYDGMIRTPAYDWADIYPRLLIQMPLSRQLIKTYHPKVCQVVERLTASNQPRLELYNPSWMLLKRELWPEPYAQYARDLPLLLRTLKRQNENLVICPFPFREQVIPAEYAAQRGKLLKAGHAEADLERLAFNKFLQEVCDAEGIRVIDPTIEFLKSKDPTELYQTRDQHLSVKGMQLCAEALMASDAISVDAERMPSDQ